MAKKKYSSINGVHKRIKNDLQFKNENSPNNINVITLYAHNGTGKTRLSKSIQEVMDEQSLCYNALFEDYFYWDNSQNLFKLQENSWVFKFIKDEGLNNKIIENFKVFTDTNITPDINTDTGNIFFRIPSSYAPTQNKIKISRGEESVFVWSVFYSILQKSIELLNDKEEERSTDIFNALKYVVIDDPVSSMDDNRIISIALEVSKIIIESSNKFNYLISTHHPLFFNVLFHKNKDTWNKKNYILSKSKSCFILNKQTNESPFAYHHTVISEIQVAIENESIKKYHFNLFRTLLEKTANFVGYSDWKLCLNGITENEDFLKIIDHYSHDKLSELEYSNLTEAQKETYEIVFEAFLLKYKFNEVNA